MKSKSIVNGTLHASNDAGHNKAKQYPDTRIPVNPDEDNDFTFPKKEYSDIELPTPEVPLNPGSDPNLQEPERIPLPDEVNPDEKTFLTSHIKHTPTNNKKDNSINTSVIIFIFSIFFSFQTLAENTSPEPSVPKVENPEVKILMYRLEEIKAIDKSNLKKEDKKALRAEVREIKKKMAETSGGIYLSAGALIIIIILLIILV